MSLSETISQLKIIPALAVLLVAAIVAMPFVFLGSDESEQLETEGVREVEMLIVANADGTNTEHLPNFSAHESAPDEHPSSTSDTHATGESHAVAMADHNVNAGPREPVTHGEHASQTHAPAEHDAHTNTGHAADETVSDNNKHTETSEHGATDSAHGDAMGHDTVVAQPDGTSLTHQTEPHVCYEIGPVKNDAQRADLEQMFRSRGMMTTLKFQNVEKDLGYWVFLPPERSLALGRLKVEEVKLKGLKDVNLLVNHEPKLAISLGIFKDQDNAYKRMLKAQSLGLKAKMDIRHMEENQMWLVLESRRENDLTEVEWSQILQQYTPIELKSKICP